MRLLLRQWPMLGFGAVKWHMKRKKADAYGPSIVKEKLVQFLAKDARTK